MQNQKEPTKAATLATHEISGRLALWTNRVWRVHGDISGRGARRDLERIAAGLERLRRDVIGESGVA
jgi:hypothetical protein